VRCSKRKAGLTRRRARARLLPTKLRGFDIARNPYNDATATTESLVALVEPDDAQLREYAAQVRAASAADLFAGAVPWNVLLRSWVSVAKASSNMLQVLHMVTACKS